MSQAARFGAVGILNTFTGLGIIFAAKALLDWGDVSANAVGYLFGLAIGFVLNRAWTFAHRGPALRAAARYLIAFLVSYAANLLAVLALRDHGVNAYLAQTLGVIPYTMVFFLLSRFFVFRTERKTAVPPQ